MIIYQRELVRRRRGQGGRTLTLYFSSADDTDNADFKGCAMFNASIGKVKKKSVLSVSSADEKLLARRKEILLQRYAGKLSFNII